MIQFEEDVKEFLKVLDPEVLRKAQNSTLTRMRSKTATRLSKEARSKYNISAAAVRDALSKRLKFSKQSQPKQAFLWYISRRIGLINFGAKFKKVRTPRGVRQAATVKLYKNRPRKKLKRAFIASGGNSNVQLFQRERAGQTSRLPIEALYGPSVAQMIGSDAVLDDAREFVKEEYPVELMRQIDFQLSKL